MNRDYVNDNNAYDSEKLLQQLRKKMQRKLLQ